MENQVKEDKNTSIKNHLLVLPYKGEKGTPIVNSMKRYVKKVLPENTNVKTASIGKRLSCCFKTKDKIKFEQQHNIRQVKYSV